MLLQFLWRVYMQIILVIKKILVAYFLNIIFPQYIAGNRKMRWISWEQIMGNVLELFWQPVNVETCFAFKRKNTV